LAHGTLIELATGRISIEEDCSGIRSLQSSLMVALFFGQAHGLSLGGRALSVFVGETLAVLLNLIRAVLLVVISASGSASHMKLWHERLGILIPVALFSGVWLTAILLSRNQGMARAMKPKTSAFKSAGFSALFSDGWKGSLMLPAGLALWFGAVEILKGVWYGHPGRAVPATTEWSVEAPQRQNEYQELPFSSGARQYLRFDEGSNWTWLAGNGLRWQALYLRWERGAHALHLARSHMPGDCLVAGGYEVLGSAGVQKVSVKGVELWFRSYVARGEAGPVQVFYCLWEEGSGCQPVEGSWLTYRNRLASVLEARGSSGQRSLELAVWGAATEEDARSGLAEALEEIIRPGQ
jgi:exosortase/archaeosortase family protein